MDKGGEKAVRAGWLLRGVQELLRRKAGIISSRAGWTGGDTPDPTKESPGNHAEAVELVFDPGADLVPGGLPQHETLS
jgi:peptide-methionine (S)-S-oxide reductase